MHLNFYLFHLMPYPHAAQHLDGYESSWVTFPNKYYDPKIGHHLYNRYLDELEYAETLGFDGVWVNEPHDLIIKAWTSTEPFQWIGKNYKLRHVNVWPRPYQQPHPPIWVPGFGSPETFRWVMEKRYTWMSLFAPQTTIHHWVDQLR